MISEQSGFKNKRLYCQAQISWANDLQELCWIPLSVAKRDNLVEDEKTKERARVVAVYKDVLLTEDEISINERHPLREATDI